MVHGARRESLGGWNEISYSWGIRSDPSLISRKRNSKARSCAAESPVRDARDATGRTQSHFRRHRLLADDRTSCRACITVPLGSYIWISLERLQPVGATSAPPSCTGAQLPTWSNLIRTCANNQCAPPSTRQPFCVCVQRARMPSRRHLRPAGGRFFSVSRDDRESPL
jgi:hypothetical protein